MREFQFILVAIIFLQISLFEGDKSYASERNLLLHEQLLNLKEVQSGKLLKEMSVSESSSNLQNRISKDRKLLLTFWATWCVSCKKELAIELPKLFKRGDLNIISINIDQDEDRVKNYLKRNQIEIPIYRDSNKSIITGLNVVNVPFWAIYTFQKGEWILTKSDEGFKVDEVLKLL